MASKNNVEIVVEIVPIKSFFAKKYLIKLPDSAYGEWLIFLNNRPVYYLNIFDTQFEKLKTKIESKETSIEKIIETINQKNKKDYSVGFKYFGFLNYNKKETKKIIIEKFPHILLENLE